MKVALKVLVGCIFAVCTTVSLPTVNTKWATPIAEIPREFPNFNQNYPFVDNSSIRENLAKNSKIDTEVDDLLEKFEETEGKQTKNEEIVIPKAVQDEDVGKKGVVEWLEDVEETEDEKFGTETVETAATTEKAVTDIVASSSATQKEEITNEKNEDNLIIKEENEQDEEETTEKIISDKEAKQESTIKIIVKSETNEPYKDGVPLIDGTAAAILVAFFLLVCLFGYITLIMWRKNLEMKYGSREILVDMDPDDMKHFSI